jgi:hypothetical protein
MLATATISAEWVPDKSRNRPPAAGPPSLSEPAPILQRLPRCGSYLRQQGAPRRAAPKPSAPLIPRRNNANPYARKIIASTRSIGGCQTCPGGRGLNPRPAPWRVYRWFQGLTTGTPAASKGLVSRVAIVNPLEAAIAAMYPSGVWNPFPTARGVAVRSA